ncbi:MAG TPA: hypothetical protein VM577_07520 [Anaerovoracaceae bacterium]|nr:hypothetical protein [Anaerovoracaceae bacterium]
MKYVFINIENIVFSRWGCIIGCIVSLFIPPLAVIYAPMSFYKLIKWQGIVREVDNNGNIFYKSQGSIIINNGTTLTCNSIAWKNDEIQVNRITSMSISEFNISWKLTFYENGIEIGYFYGLTKRSAKQFKDTLEKDLGLQ